jgi:hypothetical protein
MSMATIGLEFTGIAGVEPIEESAERISCRQRDTLQSAADKQMSLIGREAFTHCPIVDAKSKDHCGVASGAYRLDRNRR